MQEQSEKARDPECMIQIVDTRQDSGSGQLPKFSGDFLVHTYLRTLSCRCDQFFFQIYEPNCGEKPNLAMLKNR